jgi:hypothetical protein
MSRALFTDHHSPELMTWSRLSEMWLWLFIPTVPALAQAGPDCDSCGGPLNVIVQEEIKGPPSEEIIWINTTCTRYGKDMCVHNMFFVSINNLVCTVIINQSISFVWYHTAYFWKLITHKSPMGAGPTQAPGTIVSNRSNRLKAGPASWYAAQNMAGVWILVTKGTHIEV